MEEGYPSRRQYQKKRQQGKRILKKLAIHTVMAFFICGVLLMGVLAFAAVAYVRDAPQLNPELLNSPQSSTIYDMNSKKVTDIAGEEYRKVVPLDQIPKKVQNAFLSVEDARFWNHPGIDVKRVAGAAVANVKEGFGAEGGSTITQQLVKMSFLSSEKTIERKVQEAYLALKVENKYTKKEILEKYLNKVYLGEKTYGVATAAEVYFGKSVEDLNISEAALLAGLPQRPSGYNPYNHPDLAENRRNIVLSLMEEHGYISEKEKKEAQSIPVEKLLKKRENKTFYNSFTDRVIEELKEKGIDEKELFTQGLKIYTTLDPKAQSITEKVLKTNEYIEFPDDQFKAGVVLLDTKTGEVRAIGGSRHSEEVQRGFNYATQLKRQPGSTAKPVMAYGPAIEKLKWSTYEQIKDEPIELNGKVFKNWNNRFHGNVSMRKAMQWSYNIPAIKAMMEVGTEEAKQFAGKLGIPLKEVFPSYAIGGFGDGISPLQLAGAYSAFGNNGVFNEPHTVRKIVYPSGKEKSLQPKPVQAMSDYTAYMITDMLKTVVEEGTGQMAHIPGLPLAGKTGTNELPDTIRGSGVTDAWFAGYTTRYTAAVWTGYDEITQESYVRTKDSHNAKLIFKHIMSEVSKGIETPDFTMPPSVEKVTIGNRVELFVKGTAPKRKQLNIDKPKKVEDKEENKQQEVEETEKKQDEVQEEEKEPEQEKEKVPNPNEEKQENETPDTNKPENPGGEKPAQDNQQPGEDNNQQNDDQQDTGNNDKGNPGNNPPGNKDTPPAGDTGGTDGSGEKKEEPATQSPPPRKDDG
ncbi:PBP1A family penicillin-binding protein [Siminovitchia sp. FSL W7-1587]|uniref:transglycosylase domain-containing protein n=1 Tax=Siminovitchia sp. FSL W7-1587 TaxID=2954699 RepID=UPI0030CBC543